MKKPLFIAVSGACIATLTAGTAVFAAAHKTIDLDIDGNITQVTTFSGSVEKLLAEQGVTLASGDVVAPGSDSALKEGAEVVVRYQREVTVDRDGEIETLKTTALDAEELLETLDARGEAVSLVASRSNDRVSMDLRLNTNGPVALMVDGTNAVLEANHGGLQDILDSKGIELSELDRVSVHSLPVGVTALPVEEEAAEEADADKAQDPAAEKTKEAAQDPRAAALGQALDGENVPTMVTLVIQRVAVTEDLQKTEIDFETVTKKDADRFKDLGTKETAKGAKGERTKKFTVTTVDGVEESREQISDEVTKQPQDRVLVVGTKARPVPPAPKKSSSKSSSTKSSSKKSSSSSSSGSSSSGAAASGDVWAALARCESGGRANVVSSNGLYHGLYQFSVSTWKSVGGSGLPSQASPAEQTKRAKMLQARSGWGQWPACSRKIGVR